jgi:hypothetical protein
MSKENNNTEEMHGKLSNDLICWWSNGEEKCLVLSGRERILTTNFKLQNIQNLKQNPFEVCQLVWWETLLGNAVLKLDVS